MAYDRTLLTSDQVNTFLAAHPSWARDGDQLTKTYEFGSFRDAVAFVNRVAEQAEAADHHPDIDIRYRKVTLGLSTHDAGGLTFRDTKLAAEIEGKPGSA